MHNAYTYQAMLKSVFQQVAEPTPFNDTLSRSQGTPYIATYITHSYTQWLIADLKLSSQPKWYYKHNYAGMLFLTGGVLMNSKMYN